MNRSTHIVYLVIILALAGWLMLSKQHPHTSRSSTTPFMLNNADINTDTATEVADVKPESNNELLVDTEQQLRIDTLEHDNNKLMAQVEMLEQQLNNQERNATQTRAPQQPRSSTGRNNSYLPIQFDKIDEQLANEPVNHEWAYNMSTLLQDLMEGSQQLSHIQISDVQCRTQMCVIELWPNDSRTGIDLKSFYEAITESGAIDLDHEYQSLTINNGAGQPLRWVLSKRVYVSD